MEIKPIVLEGPAAKLEPLAAGHAESLAAVATPDLFTYHFPPPEFTAAGFRALIGYISAMPGFCPFAIIEPATGKAIGMTSYLDIRPQDRGLEIGFTWLATPYRERASIRSANTCCCGTLLTIKKQSACN
jgi:N-acetyltransferase